MQNEQSSVLLQKIESAHFEASAYPCLEEFAMYLGKEFAASVNDQIGSAIEVAGADFSALSGQRSLKEREDDSVLFVSKSERETTPVFVTVSSSFAGAMAEAMFGGEFTLEDSAGAATSVDAAILALTLEKVLARLGRYNFPNTEAQRRQIGARVTPIAFSSNEAAKVEGTTLCNIALDLSLESATAPGAISFHFPMDYLESQGLLEKGRKRDMQGAEESHWRRDLQANVDNSEIQLDVILDAYEARLSELTSLKVGELIPLSNNTEKVSKIMLNTAEGARLIGTGRLGAYKTHKAVKLMDALDPAIADKDR